MKINTALVVSILFSSAVWADIDPNFVDIKSVNSGVAVEMRYFSSWNFIGHPISGYQASKCYLTRQAAKALSEVQKELERKGYSLLVLDCYRPQQGVSEFVKWTQDAADLKMQSVYYVEEPKNKLVERGYIAEKSGHSRGSTVDLTIINKGARKAKGSAGRLRFQEETVDCRKQPNIESTGQLDMGTTFDCFSTKANMDNDTISSQARKNRLLLKESMLKSGFVNYPKEWWHYTLKDEPFTDKYFDFIVR